jgi:transposase InsO family protein
MPDDEAALREEIVALARIYGRYGYRRVTALLRVAGWCTNHKRVERIWRQEGLKVPPRQPKRGRLWLNDGSCIRLRPERPNHVWAYDFVEDRTRDGRKFRMLCVVDEFTREALAIRVARKLGSTEVIDVLADLFIARGVPGHIRSDNVLYRESCGRWGRASPSPDWAGVEHCSKSTPSGFHPERERLPAIANPGSIGTAPWPSPS